jgi:hypothetical protein
MRLNFGGAVSLSRIRLSLLAAGAAAVVYLSIAARAEVETVGIASAVNPDAVGTPPSGVTRTLVIGTEVLFKERIVTAAEGQAQLLFLDHSSLTVAPQSELVIDEFVYDPDRGTGKIAVSALKGLMRYVGGRISKGSEVTFTTPTAVVGIRGGIALINVAANGQTQAVFLFGQHMTVSAAGQTQIVVRPGYQVTVAQADKTPSAPTPAPKRMIEAAFKSLEAKPLASGEATAGTTEKSSPPQKVPSSAASASAQPASTSAQSTSATASNTPSNGQAASATSDSTSKQPSTTRASGPTTAATGNTQAAAAATSARLGSIGAISTPSVTDASVTTQHIASILSSKPAAILAPPKPITKNAPTGAATTTAATSNASTSVTTAVTKGTETRAASSVAAGTTTKSSSSTSTAPKPTTKPPTPTPASSSPKAPLPANSPKRS